MTQHLYDPTSAQMVANPWPVYRQLRDQAPAYFIESWNTWALSRFSDLWDYSNSHEHFSAAGGTTPPYLVTGALQPGVNLNHMDPPEHPRFRSELLPTFLPPSLRNMESDVRKIIVDCLQPLIEVGEADAYRDIGQVIAVRIANKVIGFPQEDGDYILDFMQRFFSGVGGDAGAQESSAQAMKEMRDYLTKIAQSRRQKVKANGQAENLVDTVILSSVLQHTPSDQEVGEHMVPLLVGATETFPKLAAAAVYRLWQHPAQRQELIQDKDLIPNAVRECLRFDMPTQMSMRRVIRDFSLHGETMRVGQSVMFLWASGNRDEREFEQADQFEIHRHLRRTLSFGHGVHRCLGAKLAELEARVLLEELLARSPRYTIDEANVRTASSAFFHAFDQMPIQFGD